MKAFQDLANSKGIDLTTSTPREGIQLMLAFRAQAACAACSEDMLLYQWGTYDWGNGKQFELDITRQFIEAALDDDDAISQLSLTYKFQPTKNLDALGIGNCWEDQTAAFPEFILRSPSFMAVADATPDQVELNHTYV